MKTNFKTILLLVAVVTFSLTSCSEEEVNDITVDVINTYKGTLNVADGYQSVNYEVTVTKVDNTKIKITPADTNASSFEVSIIEGGNNSIVSVSQTDTFSVVFSNVAGIDMLTYTYTNSEDKAEEFTGQKQ